MRPIGLTETHMECRYLKDSVPVATDLLAFEKIGEGPGEVTLKHPNTDWLLTIHEAGPDAPAKQMHNHWGVRVETTAEVDADAPVIVDRKSTRLNSSHVALSRM